MNAKIETLTNAVAAQPGPPKFVARVGNYKISQSSFAAISNEEEQVHEDKPDDDPDGGPYPPILDQDESQVVAVQDPQPPAAPKRSTTALTGKHDDLRAEWQNPKKYLKTGAATATGDDMDDL